MSTSDNAVSHLIPVFKDQLYHCWLNLSTDLYANNTVFYMCSSAMCLSFVFPTWEGTPGTWTQARYKVSFVCSKCGQNSRTVPSQGFPFARVTNKSFLLHDNAPAHRMVLIKAFLGKKNQCDNTVVYPQLLTWLQLIFTCPLEWNQHWRDGAFLMLLTSLRMRRESLKGFHKTASRYVANTSTIADRSV